MYRMDTILDTILMKWLNLGNLILQNIKMKQKCRACSNSHLANSRTFTYWCLRRIESVPSDVCFSLNPLYPLTKVDIYFLFYYVHNSFRLNLFTSWCIDLFRWSCLNKHPLKFLSDSIVHVCLNSSSIYCYTY